MKRSGKPLFSLAAPFLIVLSLFGFCQRDGNEKLQSIPALLVGTGLIISGAIGRKTRRKNLLLAMRPPKHGEN